MLCGLKIENWLLKIAPPMFTQDLFEETINSISSNKIRSSLTVLGIVIGIGSVIAMISIGQGAQQSIQASIQSIGSNLLMISPGQQRQFGGGPSQGQGSAQTLTLADAEAIKTVANVKAVEPQLSRRYQVTAKSLNTNTSVIGTVSNYPDVHNVNINTGAFFTDQQNSSLERVAVLGPTVVTDLFGSSTDPIGQKVRIKLIDFRVIGVTKAKGGTGFGNADDQIFVPLFTAQRYLAGATNVGSINVQSIDQTSLTTVQADITALLLERHKISDPAQADFSILNQADIVATASSVTSTFTMLLAAIAGISLVVGGIGIMNMMLTNVTERTREIGLRKAIGAEKKDISNQFLAEAVALTFTGGAVGITFGWLIAFAVSKFANIATSVSMSSILLAFGVSAGIGIVFGYYPARRAAKLSPIEALRYE
jgi:putative ABC transport system permease protein